MSDNTAAKHDFTKGSTAASIVRLSLPMILAQLVNVLYNIVDRMYLGRMPGGGAPLCSIERGRGDEKKAEQIMGNSLTLLVFFGILLTVAGYFLKTPLLYLFGASDETIPYANAYMDVYLAGNLFVMLGLGMNPFIESQGFAKTGMLTVVIGAFLNLILDPVFIFSLNMGVQGAAAATILSQLVSALWVLSFLSSRKAILRLRLPALRLKAGLVKQILALGLSGFTMSVTNSLVQIFCNASLQFYGGDLYVGAMTIIYSVREVVQMPMQGFTQGAQPVLGYNYGAGENGRVKEGIRFIRRATLLYAVALWAVLILFPQSIVRLFNKEAELLEVSVISMRWHFALFFFMAFQYVGQTVFVSLGKAKQAVFFSLFRKAILGVPLILILPRLWGLGIYGVLAAEPVTNIVGGLACYFTMMALVWRKL